MQKRFSFTEINATFYRLGRIPFDAGIGMAQENATEGFVLLLRPTVVLRDEREDMRKDACKTLADAVIPLVEAGKLACILVQFPASYRNCLENRRISWQT